MTKTSAEEARKLAEQHARKRRYLEFLDKRIPELQSMGKTEESKQDPVKIARNLEASVYPGVMARKQADREWAEQDG
jgi:hypothetical protein